MHSNPSAYHVLFENDRVRGLRYHDHPDHRTTVHAHPDSVMVTLSSSRRRLGVEGREEVDAELTAGQARWLDVQQHYGENIGDTDSQAIFVELKDTGPTTATGIGESRLGPQPRQ